LSASYANFREHRPFTNRRKTFSTFMYTESAEHGKTPLILNAPLSSVFSGIVRQGSGLPRFQEILF
jgi:hypothetical protein